MAALSPNISIITLNVNGLNAPIKIQILTGLLKIQLNYMLSLRNTSYMTM